MATIKTTADLIVALKAAPLTLKQISALDSTSFLCQQPANAVQILKTEGVQLVVTTNAGGDTLYQVTA